MKNREIQKDSISPETAEFLARLGVRSCDSDFEELQHYVQQATPETAEATPAPARWQDRIIEDNVENHCSVLDVGCGKGDLLLRLAEAKQVKVQGVELDQEMVMCCIDRGIPVYHGDLEESLRTFQDRSFDYVILEETLQTLRHPMAALRELLRVGRKCFISFPNFAHWNVRLAFSLGGRMPRTGALPYSWHDTPNIHLCSINDFMDWTVNDKVDIDCAWVLANGKVLEYRPEHNLIAEQALFLVHPRSDN